MESQQRRRWYQFSVVALFVVLTIATVVALAGYAWKQRQVASTALERANEIDLEAEHKLRFAMQMDYQARVLYHFLGIDALTAAEYEMLMQMLKDNSKATKASEHYEMWAKTIGEELPADRRSYPNMISHLVDQVRRRDEQLVQADTTMKALQVERERFRQEADEYKTRCRQLQETIDKLREP